MTNKFFIMYKFRSLMDVEIVNLPSVKNGILGIGGFSEVKLVRHVRGGALLAMKSLFKKNDTEV